MVLRSMMSDSAKSLYYQYQMPQSVEQLSFFEQPKLTQEDVQNIQQSLDMWNGIINSRFTPKETPYHIQTVSHPERDMIAARLSGGFQIFSPTGINR